MQVIRETALYILVVCCLLGCKSNSPISKTTPLVTYQHPIAYQPATYVCYQTTEQLVIDGRIEEQDWQQARPTNTFVDIEGYLQPNPSLTTTAKMLWDDDFLYIAFIMEEPHIWATLKERDDIVFRDDAVEIFIDPDGDGHLYGELQVNAFNTLWDLLLIKPYRIDTFSPKAISNWNVQAIKSEVHIIGSLNDSSDKDTGWSVEMAIPWESLQEITAVPSPPNNGDQWRINLSRVDWLMHIQDGQYVKKNKPNSNQVLQETYAVWSPQGRIALHQPETWGYVQFAKNRVGDSIVQFDEKPDEKIKWALWQLHYQQVAYFKKYRNYAEDLAVLTPVSIELTEYAFKPKLEIYKHAYQISTSSYDQKATWFINEQGRIWME